MANRFLNNITINDEYTLPAADGTADQIITTNGEGQLGFVDQSTIASGSAEVVEVPVKNMQGSALTKGDPVYISGSVGASGKLEVKLADASDSSKMPAVGLLKQDLAIDTEGFAVVTGKLRNLITSPIDGATPNPNDVIYVKPNGTTGAALTLTRPAGSSNLIQNMGKVGRASTSNDGTFVVSSILRSNDVPNLPEGRLFVGTSANTSLVSDVVYVDDTNDRVGIGTNNPTAKTHIEQIIANGTIAYPLKVDVMPPGSNAFGDGTGISFGVGNNADSRKEQARITVEQNYYGVRPSMSFDTTDYNSPYTDFISRILIDPQGNVGINDKNPSYKLDVAGTGRFTDILRSDKFLQIQGAGTTANEAKGIGLNIWEDFAYVGNDSTTRYLNHYGMGIHKPLQASIAGGNGAYLSGYFGVDIFTAGNSRIHVNQNGNVGIGTTSPNADLTVRNGASNTSVEILSYNSAAGTEAALKFSTIGSETNFKKAAIIVKNASGSWGRNDMHFALDSAEDNSNVQFSDTKMTILNGGDVGVGTTTPDVKFEVESTTSASGIRIKNTSSGFASLDIESNRVTGDNLGGLRYRKTGQANSQAEINYVSNVRFDFLSGSGTSAPTQKLSILNNGNVGIGINNPSELLHLRSTGPARLLIEADSDNVTETDNAQIILKQDGGGVVGRLGYRTNTNDLELLNEYSSNIYLGTSNSIRATLHANGNFGIGNSTPQAKLHVSNGLLRTWSPASGTSAIFESTVSSRNFVTLTAANEAELWFGNASTQTLGRIRYEMAGNNMEFWTNATQKMVIEGAGNVGIGITDPSHTLEVKGTVQIKNGSSGYLYLQNTNNFLYGDQYGNTIIRSANNFRIQTKTNGGESVRVNSSGNVGIGTTNPNSKLEIVVPDYYNGCKITGPGNGSLSWSYMSFYAGTSFRGNILPTSTGVSYSSASDYRLKENVTKLQNSTERVKKLKPSNFNFLENPSKTVDGFIAHEVQEVVPEAVTGEKDAVGRDGRPEYQGIDQSKIVPLLTAALQEAISKIEQLETRIQKLENK